MNETAMIAELAEVIRTEGIHETTAADAIAVKVAAVAARHYGAEVTALRTKLKRAKAACLCGEVKDDP